MEYKMTTDNFLSRHCAKLPAIKKIVNIFSRSFAITKTEIPCMIINISLINHKQSITDLKTQTRS